MKLAVDTETTGLDGYHGCSPFIITTCSDNDEIVSWEWNVDPLTRIPQVDLDDLRDFLKLWNAADQLYFQNAPFDLKMISLLEPSFQEIETKKLKWSIPWDKIHDTTLSAHMLGSCQRKDLTTQALIYLGVNIQPYEDAVHLAVEKARSITRLKKFKEQYGQWATSAKDRVDMPSSKSKLWAGDMWLPRAVVLHAPDYLPETKNWHHGDNPQKHPWATVTMEYAEPDPEVTLHIAEAHERKLEEKGILSIYEERRKLIRIVHLMKDNGVSISGQRTKEAVQVYEEETVAIHTKCLRLANTPELTKLPVNGCSNALRHTLFNELNLPVVKKTKGGSPSVDKGVIEAWTEMLDKSSKQYHFVKGLRDYRQRSTALSYMKGYKRFWLKPNKYKFSSEVRKQMVADGFWFVLHPNLNPTGTSTLRWSSSNPNEQNISKKEGFNLRYCFGPLPGRRWASLDYENVELRIPAYESGEADLIYLFENPDAAPFYGSVHLLNFSTVYPDIWEHSIRESSFEEAAAYIKKKYKSTWYQRCKNGGFAVQYGSVDRDDDQWSTADKAFGKKGCHALLKARFGRLESLNQKCIRIANATGFVETIPDKEVCPEHGYPIQCSRNKWDRISPTIPLNYHVQGTACWVIMRAMIKVQEYLDEINEGKKLSEQWFITMQVHDELVIDYPICKDYKKHLLRIKHLMESCGDPVNTVLRVGCEIHEDNWSTGYSLAV